MMFNWKGTSGTPSRQLYGHDRPEDDNSSYATDISEEEDEDDDDDESSDMQAVNPIYNLEEAIRTQVRASDLSNEDAIVAAVSKYHQQQSLDDLQIIKRGTALMSAEHLAQLLIPGRSDVRVRAYLRSISESTNAPGINEEAQQEAQLLLSVMEAVSRGQKSISRSDLWRLALQPVFRYALVRAYLASGRGDHILRAKELLLGRHRIYEWASDRESRAGANLRVPRECSLVQAWHMLGEIRVAKSLLEEMLRERTAALDESHPQVLDLRLALAVAYGMDGQVPKALSLLQEVLQLQKKYFGAYRRSLPVIMNLVLSLHVKAEQNAAVDATLCSMNELLKHNDVQQPLLEDVSPSHPEERASLQPEDQRSSAGSSGHASDDTGSLQQLIDHMISNLPSDVSMPPDLQRRIAAYKKGMSALSGSQASKTTARGVRETPPSSQDSGLPIPGSLPTNTVSSSASASAASSGMMVASAAGAASISTPIAIGAAALTASGAIGMAVVTLYKLFVVDVTTAKAAQEANQIKKDEQYADSPAGFKAMLDVINGMSMAEEVVARSENDFERLKEINKTHAADLADFRSQVAGFETTREAVRQRTYQTERESADIRSQQKATIKSLKRELKDLKLKLERANQQQQGPSNGQDIRMLELESSSLKREQEMKLAAASAAEVEAKRAAAKSSALLLTTQKIVESQQSQINALKALSVDTRRERDDLQTELLEKVSSYACDDLASRIDERARSAIKTLHTELGHGDFGGVERKFLDCLDPNRQLDVVVRTLCGRLEELIPTVHRDRILTEEQNAQATKDMSILRAELKKAETKIPAIQEKLCDALCKEVITQHDLSKAKRELAEAANHSCAAIQQEAAPRDISWWHSVWTTR
jgi:hypothetical protein